MGSRGRSIRLRMYFLVAIPLITMLGLFGYVAYTSVTNWLNLDRAPSLIQSTSEPLTNFVNVLQAERRTALVYLAKPGSGTLASYQTAVTSTKTDAQQLAVTLSSPATTSNSTPAETAAIAKMLKQVNGMTALRTGVVTKQLAPLDAFVEYTNIIAGQGAVLQAEAASITDAGPVLQGMALIAAVNTQEDMSEQDAVLASALASGTLTGDDRVAFSQAVGRQQDDTMTYQQLFTPAELSTYNATVNQLAPKAVQDHLTTVQEAVAAGIPLSAMEQQGLNPATWQTLTRTWLKASSTAGTSTASSAIAAIQQPATDAKRRVWITAAIGAAGLVLTLIVTISLAQSINRRLGALRRSALTLAQEQLPAVIARLRRGESVDIAAEAPPLRAGNDEIGQVGEAIDTVRQTAIRAAVEEARVRQGVNDMFRNLARRNQSLLQRQLTVLDGMERRATDPDVLEDLFKMDHLTTRMRRHAEGLIILSGAAPGRSWSAPVKLIDVMRGAVAEVEDYARVTVSTQSRAALAGSAVTDVIHLLAELIENATSLSPPFTQVRVSGETVANGFAIEIEDRGLGMVPQRMQELNERLANPPDINPANTEQLGLFVVGQLGRRHGIRVMLRPSPYGGTTAVALIPSALMVEEGPAAITAGARTPAAAGAAASGGYANGANGGYRGGNGNGASGNGAYAGAANGNGNGAYAGPNGNGYASSGGYPASPAGVGPVGAGVAGAGAPGRAADDWRPSMTPAGFPSRGTPDPRGGPGEPGDYATEQQDAPAPPIRIVGALRHPSETSGYGPANGAGTAPGAADALPRRGRHGDDVPVVTGVPVGRAVTPPPSAEFDVFTPIRRPDQNTAPADAPYAQSYLAPGGQPPGGPVSGGPVSGGPVSGGPVSGGQPAGPGYADPYGGPSAAGARPDAPSYQEPAYQEPAYQQGAPQGGTPPGETAYRDGEGGDLAAGGFDGGEPDFNGLPRRVRQANLAPQLRVSATTGTQEPAGVPPASAASLSDMRNTLSAMQRGWQQGRSQTQRDTQGESDGN